MIKKLLLSLLLSFSLISNCWADGNDANTVSLLHMDGTDASTTFTDDAIGGTHTWTAAGTAQIDTAQKKFGTGSGLFSVGGNWISTPYSSDFDFGSGNFTIDFPIYFTDKTLQQYFFGNTGADSGYYVYKRSNTNGNKIGISAYTGTGGATTVIASEMTSNWSVNDGEWHHLAFVRNGSNFAIYIDGVSQALSDDTFDNDWSGITDAAFIVGNVNTNPGIGVNAQIDEFRVSKGIARWTSNFTPPTSAYSAVSSTPSMQVIYIQ